MPDKKLSNGTDVTIIEDLQEIILDALDQEGLDHKYAPLIGGMLAQESTGNPEAVSPAGAEGLMQIMPEMQKALGVKDPKSPEQSIRGGVKLFAEELKRFKDPRLAVAAYNAGSPRVGKAIKDAGTSEFEKVKVHLPPETRAYVPRVDELSAEVKKHLKAIKPPKTAFPAAGQEIKKKILDRLRGLRGATPDLTQKTDVEGSLLDHALVSRGHPGLSMLATLRNAPTPSAPLNTTSQNSAELAEFLRQRLSNAPR